MENPQNVMSELMNFMKNRIVLTASELDIFTKLESPLTIGEMAEKEQFDIKGLTRLLDSLVAVGYLQKQKDRYHNTEKGMLFSSHHP
jgi:DNA-binding MarR family transcriptional regulator